MMDLLEMPREYPQFGKHLTSLARPRSEVFKGKGKGKGCCGCGGGGGGGEIGCGCGGGPTGFAATKRGGASNLVAYNGEVWARPSRAESNASLLRRWTEFSVVRPSGPEPQEPQKPQKPQKEACPLECRVRAKVFAACCGRARRAAQGLVNAGRADLAMKLFEELAARCTSFRSPNRGWRYEQHCSVPPCPARECTFSPTAPGRPPTNPPNPSHCVEWEARLKGFTDVSATYSAFKKLMDTWSKSREAHPPHTEDSHSGFNTSSVANGGQNVAHFTKALSYGLAGVAAAFQYTVDHGEHGDARNQAEKDEKEAEMYADLVTMFIFGELEECMGIFATDRDWWRCKYLVSQMWYDFFCVQWE